jgi:hypothetical protein
LGLGVLDPAVDGDVVEDEVAKLFGVPDCDVQQVVIFACDVERGQYARDLGESGVEPQDVVAVVI